MNDLNMIKSIFNIHIIYSNKLLIYYFEKNKFMYPQNAIRKYAGVILHLQKNTVRKYAGVILHLQKHSSEICRCNFTSTKNTF